MIIGAATSLPRRPPADDQAPTMRSACPMLSASDPVPKQIEYDQHHEALHRAAAPAGPSLAIFKNSCKGSTHDETPLGRYRTPNDDRQEKAHDADQSGKESSRSLNIFVAALKIS
jgi:hypothetical protein